MGTQWISPADGRIAYTGRIEFQNPEAPVFAYACSNFRFRIKGGRAVLVLGNRHSYCENALGALADGAYRGKFLLHDGEKTCGETAARFLMRLRQAEKAYFAEKLSGCGADARVFDISYLLDGGEHELTIFKRMDGCHYFTFYGMILEEGTELLAAPERPARRIEVYGDSVSCGEVSEAVGCCGMPDPENNEGVYSNSFYSYSWTLARRLGAELHDVAQGGICLLDGDGYFNMPECVGMLSCYDKTLYHPGLGEVTPWNFERYTPHVVIVAIGQNDSHPENYMAEDYEGEKARHWRAEYRRFIGLLRERYPRARIVLTTTILGHDPAWDRAIDQAARELGDEKVHHFLYSRNGIGTSGHIRKPEAEEMAEELAAFIESLGEDIWKD